jgi:hypothetical protein
MYMTLHATCVHLQIVERCAGTNLGWVDPMTLLLDNKGQPIKDLNKW